MRLPPGRSERKGGAVTTPPGGRAAERVNQDRKSRGLPATPARPATTLIVEPAAAAKTARRPAATKKRR